MKYCSKLFMLSSVGGNGNVVCRVGIFLYVLLFVDFGVVVLMVARAGGLLHGFSFGCGDVGGRMLTLVHADRLRYILSASLQMCRGCEVVRMSLMVNLVVIHPLLVSLVPPTTVMWCLGQGVKS